MKSIVFVILLFLPGCADKQTPFTEERMILAKDQTKKIAQIGLTVTNHGCGRKWISDGDNPSYERPYCDIEVKYKDSTVNMGGNFEPVHIGDIEIKVEQMNPWGRGEDSIPAGGCQVLVKKVAGSPQ